MLDLQFIAENKNAVAENCQNRNVKVDLDRLLELRDKRSKLIVETDDLRREQKETSAKIPKAADDAERQIHIARGKELREQISVLDDELKSSEHELRGLQSQVPNMTHPDSPVGKSEDESVAIRESGSRPQFDFKPLDHVELGEKLDLIDFESAAKVAGSGFYYLKNEAVLLELALVQFATQKLREKGFTIHITPDLARDSILEGIGFIPRGDEAQIYSIDKSDLSLVATAEITLGGMLQNEIIEVDRLPLKMAGISHCFRTEAGAHGKASRGLYRVHQFTKVEMFGFTAPTLEASNAFHQEVLAIEEEIFQSLGLHYRVLDICTGDMGGSAYRKYDLEAWMPGRGDEGEFGEVTSCSNCTDYQSRRLAIRCKDGSQKGTQFVHTLNGTAIAVSRAMIAIMENYQQADGSVVIPEILRKWVGVDRIEPKG